MTKATPAGRTLTEDPPAFPGGNPNHPESGPSVSCSQAGCLDKKAPSAQAPRGFFFRGFKLDVRTRLRLAALIVFLTGLLSGAAIYLTAADEPAEPTAYVIVGDTAYPVDPTGSKAYVHQLERFGGKAAVLFDEFDRWFAGLWQGKTLGITLASLGAFAALVLFALSRIV